MERRRIAKTSEQARHEIATAAVGLFIALAFALMADGFKDAWKEPKLHGPVTLDSIVFTLTALSFFLGTQAWLWSDAIQTADTPQWLYNFFFTLITLIVITMMGAFVGSERIFYSWTFSLYAVQCAWRAGGGIRRFCLDLSDHEPERFIQRWWSFFALLGIVIFVAGLTPVLPIHTALPIIALLRTGNMAFDLFWAVPMVWGRTEQDTPSEQVCKFSMVPPQ